MKFSQYNTMADITQYYMTNWTEKVKNLSVFCILNSLKYNKVHLRYSIFVHVYLDYLQEGIYIFFSTSVTPFKPENGLQWIFQRFYSNQCHCASVCYFIFWSNWFLEFPMSNNGHCYFSHIGMHLTTLQKYVKGCIGYLWLTGHSTYLFYLLMKLYSLQM